MQQYLFVKVSQNCTLHSFLFLLLQFRTRTNKWSEKTRQARGGEGRGHHDPETPAPGLGADTDTGLMRHGTLPDGLMLQMSAVLQVSSIGWGLGWEI